MTCIEGRNTYRLLGTLGFKKYKFNKRIGRWDSTSLHRQRRQSKDKRIVIMALFHPLLLHGSFLRRMELSLTSKEGKVSIWEAETINMAVWRTRGICHLFKMLKLSIEKYVVRS